MAIKSGRGILGTVSAAVVVAGLSATPAAPVVPAAADTAAEVSGGTWGNACDAP